MHSSTSLSLLLLLSLFSTSLSTTQLTLSTYESSLTSGKNVLVKYYQEWCGHCKEMQPTYDKLASDYEDSGSVLIAEVDCDKQEEICEAAGVQGYPTLKYFLQGEQNDYEGSRDYEGMASFVRTTLVRNCDLENSASCSERALKYSSKMMMKSNGELEKEIERLEGMEGGKMAVGLASWIGERKGILKQLKGGEL